MILASLTKDPEYLFGDNITELNGKKFESLDPRTQYRILYSWLKYGDFDLLSVLDKYPVKKQIIKTIIGYDLSSHLYILINEKNN